MTAVCLHIDVFKIINILNFCVTNHCVWSVFPNGPRSCLHEYVAAIDFLVKFIDIKLLSLRLDNREPAALPAALSPYKSCQLACFIYLLLNFLIMLQ